MLKKREDKKIEYLISLFFNTGRMIHERSREDTVDPISMLKVEALRAIAEQRPTMKVLASYLRVTAPTVTSLVNTLVRGGYCSRIPDEHDKRSMYLEITPKGKIFFEQGLEKASRHAKEILSSLQPESIDSFIHIMEDIKKAYENKK